MMTRIHILPLSICCVFAFLLCGCVAPPPQAFVDADSLPSHYVGLGYRATASDELLTIEVSQSSGPNVVGFDAVAHDGALYISPQRISSGGGGMNKFDVDVSRFHLAADWPNRTYWLVESYAYPIGNPGFWSAEKRSPWVRRKMEITKR